MCKDWESQKRGTVAYSSIEYEVMDRTSAELEGFDLLRTQWPRQQLVEGGEAVLDEMPGQGGVG